MIVLSITSFFSTWTTDWLPLALLTVMITIIIYATVLMFARAFSIKELEAFVKAELLQAIATAFMAIFLVMLVEGTMGLAREFITGDLICNSQPMHIGTTNETTMDEAYAVIQCRLQERAKSVADLQDAVMWGGDSWAEFNLMNMVLSIFGITWLKGDWIGSLYQLTETKRIINNLATVLIIGLDAQFALLEYLKVNMLHVFIPVGILLRSFYFTRGPGALFISIGIGMYFIFPVMFVLLDPGFIASPSSPQLDIPPQQPYCYPTMSTTITMMQTLENAGLGGSSGLALASLRDNLAKAYIMLMLHPLIALFVTLVIVRYMMSVLGADTYELMKMVGKVV